MYAQMQHSALPVIAILATGLCVCLLAALQSDSIKFLVWPLLEDAQHYLTLQLVS